MKLLALFLCQFLGGFMLHASPFSDPQDPILDEIAKEVPLEEIQSQEVQDLIDYMLRISKGERTDVNKSIMVGLAAPQIGISKRIIIVDLFTSRENKDISHDLQAFINPKITWKSDEKEQGHEGCYSTGAIKGSVPRHTAIEIEAYDRFGVKIKKKFEGFPARVFQHEVDHLDGLRFIDRMDSDFVDVVYEDEASSYRENHENWHRRVPKEDWKSHAGVSRVR